MVKHDMDFGSLQLASNASLNITDGARGTSNKSNRHKAHDYNEVPPPPVQAE